MRTRTAICLLSCLASGCASVTGTTGQSVSVETRFQEKQVTGASCELSNNKGKWFVSTPASVQIRRSNDDLIVVCSKEGVGTGSAAVASETKGSMFGNILLGGGIGAIVDHNSGAAYEYPTVIQVMLNAITPAASQKTSNGPSPSVAATPPPNATPANQSLEFAKTQCKELGFEDATDSFRNCVIKLVK